MTTNKEMIEEAKYEARGIMAEYGANKMSYMMEDMDKFITTLLTKHEEAVVERERALCRKHIPEDMICITIEGNVLVNRKFVSMQSIKASNGRTLLLEAEASAHQILEALTTNPTSNK